MGDGIYVPGAGPQQQQSSANPFGPYSVGNPGPAYQVNSAGAPRTGTYVGVPDDYKVQVGVAPDPNSQPYMGAGYGMGGGSIAETQGVYKLPIYTYDDLAGLRGQAPSRVFDVQRALYNTGYLPKGFRAGFYDKNTEEALGAAMADANRNGMTLQDMFGNIAAGQKGLKKVSGGGPRDITSTSVSLTGRAGAQAVLTQALAQQLGRDPTPTEVTRFLNSLNTEEKASPSVTHTHISAGGGSQSSTTTQSNVDPSGAALDFAKTNPGTQGERTKYQDSLYYDVIANMLSGNAGG